jgi:RimJ/RimL family protein N-acetyltransferase
VTGLEIRTATESDAEELLHYATRLFGEDLPGVFRRPIPTMDEEREFIRSHIEPANSTLLLAVLDGEIVGLVDFVGGTLAEESHAGTFGLSVDGARRGQGIGTALIEALISWAPEHGISRIQAWAWVNNPGAIALYERLGFVREGLCRQAVVVDGEPIDVMLLARLLVDP